MNAKANDAKIKKLMQTVEDKKKALGTKPRKVLDTNGVFKYPSGDHFNINATNDTKKIVAALAFLLQWENTHRDAAGRLGLDDDEPYVHDGYTVEAWGADFKHRVAVIEYERKKRELDALKRKLDGLISADGKTEMELESIEALLK